MTESYLDKWLTVKETQSWQDVSCYELQRQGSLTFHGYAGAWKHSIYQSCQKKKIITKKKKKIIITKKKKKKKKKSQKKKKKKKKVVNIS